MLPQVRGVIERRILVNYHVDPAVLAALLPPPFRPKLHRGRGVAGICLIRLGQARPGRLPAWLGGSSENAAHRVAVEWEEGGRVREGVFVPRRHTDSCLNRLAGGRLFPGYQGAARFDVREDGASYAIRVRGDDGELSVDLAAHLAESLAAGSIFHSLEEASAFFERGALGYSSTPEAGTFQGVELRCERWQVEPLAVSTVRSSFFDDPSRFPPGSIAFDCALLMRDVDHAWLRRETSSKKSMRLPPDPDEEGTR